MTATATLTIPRQRGELSPKQLNYQRLYADVDRRRLTDNIVASWHKPAPAPLATFKQNPRKFILNKLELLVVAALFAYIGMLIVAACYYGVFETTDTMNNWWHGFIPNDEVRHAIRDVGEGLLGGILGVTMVRNRYKPLKPLTWLDRLEIRLHIANVKDDKPLSIWQVLATPFLVIIYANVGFWMALGAAYYIRHGLQHSTLESIPAPGNGKSLISRAEFTVTASWPEKLIGYASAFFMGRRPAKGVCDDLQWYMAQQRVLSGAYQPPLYWVPTWKASFNEAQADKAAGAADHGAWPERIIKTIALIGFGLACWGFYIMTVIAKRHH
jgi:hypothetical protein